MDYWVSLSLYWVSVEFSVCIIIYVVKLYILSQLLVFLEWTVRISTGVIGQNGYWCIPTSWQKRKIGQ